MKISKLFHWLYASVMFLPVFFLLPTAFYYGFNDYATAQEVTKEEAVYYSSNVIETKNDFIIDNIYQWDGQLNPAYFPSSNLPLFTIKKTNNLSFLNNYNDISALTFIYSSNGNAYLYCSYQGGGDLWYNVNIKAFDFVYLSASSAFNSVDLLINHFNYTDYQLLKGYTDVTYTMSITDSMNNAWQDIWDLPMFTWTSNTFFSAPFTYIADLFGIEATNPLCNALSYWFSISIIWLTFDLFIYVPLLVHRWLDKGVLE